MEKCCETPCPLSKKRLLILFLHYFIGFQFLYPMLMGSLTLRLDPTARMVPDWMQFLVYCFMIVSTVFIAWPLLKESVGGLRRYGKSMVKLCLLLFVAYYLCSFVISLLILLVSETETSANQMEVVASISASPLLTMFSTLIYAPIVEEIIFRGVFYRSLRPHMKWLPAALISAFVFGFIHVMLSLFAGNFNDLIYLLSYGLIGFYLALAYEKSDTIYGSMIFHFINNAVAFLFIII